MKAIILVAVLCLLSTSAFSIGRPHNVFAVHKAVTERVANQPKKNVLPQPSILKNVTDGTKRRGGNPSGGFDDWEIRRIFIENQSITIDRK